MQHNSGVVFQGAQPCRAWIEGDIAFPYVTECHEDLLFPSYSKEVVRCIPDGLFSLKGFTPLFVQFITILYTPSVYFVYNIIKFLTCCVLSASQEEAGVFFESMKRRLNDFFKLTKNSFKEFY